VVVPPCWEKTHRGVSVSHVKVLEIVSPWLDNHVKALSVALGWLGTPVADELLGCNSPILVVQLGR
jgi:hypothetical protein